MSSDNSHDKSLSNNILIRLLKVVSDEEWKDFEKFVCSPYFNDGRNYMALLKILKKFHPEFNSPDFTKTKLYQKLYPGKKFKESVLSSMFSRLYNIGEEYLIYTAIKKDNSSLREKLIIKELRSRGAMLKLNKIIEAKLKHLTQKKFENNDFRNLYDISIELNKLNQTKNSSEIFYKSITELLKYAAYTFLYELNLYHGAIYSLKNYWKDDFDKSFLQEIFQSIDFEKILSVIEKADYKNFVPMKMVYLSYLATRFPENDDYFYSMKELYKQESENFELNFREIILTNLTSICSMKLLLGKSEFKYEAFEIRKLLISENGLFLNDDYMKAGDFRSVFLDALNVGQVEWGRNFFETNLSKVHPDFRTDLKNYCHAWLAYERGEHDKAIDYAGKVNVGQITFKLDVKNILARAYYDTDSTEPLLSLLNSYYQLIKNSGSKNKSYLGRQKNFIKYMKKLIALKGSIQKKKSNKLELEALLDNIQSDNVSGKSWLNKKINELT